EDGIRDATVTGVQTCALPILRRERDELKDQMLRRRAEFENFRKRVERERQQAGEDAVAKVLQALVPVLDNLDRALEAEGSDASLDRKSTRLNSSHGSISYAVF